MPCAKSFSDHSLISASYGLKGLVIFDLREGKRVLNLTNVNPIKSSFIPSHDFYLSLVTSEGTLELFDLRKI